MRGVLRGIIAICMGVLVWAPPVSAAETVITARVMPVRHIVVDEAGVVQRIISNTSENVTPIVHLGSAEGREILLTDDVKQRYETVIAGLDMSGPADYTRKSPFKLALAYVQSQTTHQLKLLSQIKLLALN